MAGLAAARRMNKGCGVWETHEESGTVTQAKHFHWDNDYKSAQERKDTKDVFHVKIYKP